MSPLLNKAGSFHHTPITAVDMMRLYPSKAGKGEGTTGGGGMTPFFHHKDIIYT